MFFNRFKTALIAVTIFAASALLAFDSPVQQFYWYEVDEQTGQITDTQIDPEALCEGLGELCAVGFSAAHYGIGAGDPAPVSDPDDLMNEDPENYDTVERTP